MHFPFSYTGELVFYKPDDFDIDQFLSQIKSEVAINESDKTSIIFSAPFSFTRMPVRIKLSVTDGNTYINCTYKISLFESNLLLLMSLLFSFFFFYHQSPIYGVLILIAGFVYYILNLATISGSVKSLIYKQIGGFSEIETSTLWKQQKQWMKDANRCPACGEQKNTYSNKCINCGLFFQDKAPEINQVNTSLSGKNEIVYEVTKNKK